MAGGGDGGREYGKKKHGGGGGEERVHPEEKVDIFHEAILLLPFLSAYFS